mmetsp:Transcript_54971/g.98805  ORF Transcript_54971/g.98805 Transcript_54971/m.98805 type:complete len:408 (+) Transcript_54971:60-1283(+)
MGAQLSEPITAMVVEQTTTSSWSASSVSMQGWRRTHEDTHIFDCAAGGNQACGVFAVLDGHGGQTAANLSSGILQDLLVGLSRRGTLSKKTAPEELSKAFIDCDQKLRNRMSAEDRSGTTCVAAIVSRPKPTEYCVQLAHCGDSRAVVSVGSELVCSEDHKPGRQDEVQRIRSAGGSVEPGALGGPLRVDGALAVSRSFGDFHYKDVGLAPCDCKVSALPDVQTVSCAPGDWFLLACDGVFDVLSNEEVKEFVARRIGEAGPGPLDAGALLVDLLRLCLNKGSKDNITALFVHLLPDCKTKPYTRELLQGDAATAQTEVRNKYIEFFESQGFNREAAAMRSTVNKESVALPSASSSGILDGGEASGEAPEGAASSPSAAGSPSRASSWLGSGQRAVKALAMRARLRR